MSAPENVSESYDGSRAVFRLLRLETWGSPLMNLGYFVFHGPLAFLNVLASVAKAQHRLVLKSARLLDVQRGHHVLDVACGRGKSSFILHCLNPEATVVGVDLLERHIATAQTLYANARNLSYVAGNAMWLDFPDHSIDRLLCLEAAFHFPDRAQFLREAFRVVRPGGRVVVVDFAWTSDAHRVHRDDPETRVVREIWQWDDFASVPEYERMAARAGFRLTGRHDWSGRVTRPIQTQLNCVAALAKTTIGRNFLCWKNPLYRSFSPADWHDCALAAPAQGHVVRHSKYMAFVLEKP
jgi:ubiquinone/menaquinone biosynthesis C-methylase UbiE